MSQFLKRVLKVRPGAQVAIIGDDLYENIVWGAEVPIPEETLLAQDGALLEDAVRASIPAVVSMRQARLALLSSGLLASVNSAVGSLDAAATIEWEYATEVRRDSPLVSGLSAMLSLTPAQLDALFTSAATL